MRLDELKQKIDEALETVPGEYEVTVRQMVSSASEDVSIAWVEIHSDGLRIHLEM